MNELIKNLADRAKRECVTPGAFTADEYLETFAKLVAEECVKLCQDHSEFLLRFSQFGANAAEDCAKIIKEKFDV